MLQKCRPLSSATVGDQPITQIDPVSSQEIPTEADIVVIGKPFTKYWIRTRKIDPKLCKSCYKLAEWTH